MNCPDCGYPNPTWRSSCEKCGESLVKPNSIAEPTPTMCLNCGYVGLPTHRGTCASCDAGLDPTKYYRSPASPRNRPALIRFYVSLLSFGAIISGFCTLVVLFFSFIIWASEDDHGFITIGLVIAGLLLGLTVLLGVTAVSLYGMKKRGRILALIALGIGIVLNGFVCVSLFFISVGSSDGLSPMCMCGSIIGIPIQAYILDWLLTNEHRFRN